MDPGTLLRAARRRRRLSQRELAQISGLNAATIGRIESGASSAPGWLIMLRILRSVGFSVQVVNALGEVLVVEEPHDDRIDDGERRLPAHLRGAWTEGGGRQSVRRRGRIVHYEWPDRPRYAVRRRPGEGSSAVARLFRKVILEDGRWDDAT